MIGGDGSTANNIQGCGGSGGRIAMFFNKNFTFSGSWDVFGGDTLKPECDGASGTAFFYHNGNIYIHYYGNDNVKNCISSFL